MAKKKKRPLLGQPISPVTVWIAVIASTLVAILLYLGLIWLENQTSTNTITEAPVSQPELSGSALIIIGLPVCAFVFGPAILVALIVLPIIRKNNRK